MMGVSTPKYPNTVWKKNKMWKAYEWMNYNQLK